MSLIDTLAKWALDKADEKFFDSNELTDQQRIEKLYRALDMLERVFNSWIEALQPYSKGPHYNLEKDLEGFDDFLNKPPKSLMMTIEQAAEESQNLEFLAAREGIDVFGEAIADNIMNILKALCAINYQLNLWRGSYGQRPELQKEISRLLGNAKKDITLIASAKQALLNLSKKLD